jgi:carboxyl-terminal processing protease
VFLNILSSFTSTIFQKNLPEMIFRKLRRSMPYMAFTVAVLGMGILMGAGWAGKGRSREEDLILVNSIKFRELLSLIHSDYIDPTDTDSLADAALESIVEELDPHSSYIPRKEVFSGNAQLESNFEGIGAEFQFIDDTIWVSGVLKDSPSEKAGLKSGDRILTVNHIAVSGVNISQLELTHLVRGPKGTPVVAGIMRTGHNGMMTLQMTRDRIRSKSVDYFAMTGPDQGYIKCSRFTHSTAVEVREALMFLLSSGMKSLVFDLRDNSGGYVSSSIKVADEFLRDKQLIVFTAGRNPENNTKTYATSSGLFESGNLVVLINENTASAAEIVAGALQDHDRALIVGRRSFGKGLVQAPITLTDGSEVRLTISRYFTPSGRCIQKGFQRKKSLL